MSARFHTDEAVVHGHLTQQRYEFASTDTEAVTIVVRSGTVQAGSGTSVTLDADASSMDDAYNGYGFVTTGGTGSGQDRARIADYNGTTKVATLTTALTTALSTDTTYEIINRGYA